MVAKNVMIPNSASIYADAPLADAAAKMRDQRLTWLHVLNDAKSVGVVTERDIVTRAAARGLDPLSTKIREVMSANVLHCRENEEVMAIVMIAARKRIQWVIVLNGDHRPVGRVLIREENHQRSMMR